MWKRLQLCSHSKPQRTARVRLSFSPAAASL
jgi:hypothetical protein